MAKLNQLNQWLVSPLHLSGKEYSGEFARDCRLALIRLGKLSVEGFSKEELPGIETTRELTTEEASALYQTLMNINTKLPKMNLDTLLAMQGVPARKT